MRRQKSDPAEYCGPKKDTLNSLDDRKHVRTQMQRDPTQIKHKNPNAIVAASFIYANIVIFTRHPLPSTIHQSLSYTHAGVKHCVILTVE